MGKKRLFLGCPLLLNLCDFGQLGFKLSLQVVVGVSRDAEFAAVRSKFHFQLLLAHVQLLHFLGKPLVILLGALRHFLELLVLGFVLLEDVEHLLLLFNFDFCLLLVGFNLLLEPVGLAIDLGRQRRLDRLGLAALLLNLLIHHFDLLGALFLEGLVLFFQLFRLFPYGFVFFLIFCHIFCHLRANGAEMGFEVFADLFSLVLLVVLDLGVALLELLVLRVVLPRDLLVLQPDDFCLRTPVLVLQCLLVI